MTVNATTLSRNEAQIRSVLNSYATMADQGAFEYLGRLFAPELVIDYSSLFGGEPQTVKREQLMKQWAGFLPGFDTTYHELSDHQIEVDGNRAKASVAVTASHWLGEKGFWQVSGSYDFTLIRADGSWQISSVRIDATGEKGSRDVLGDAPARAENNLEARMALRVNYEQ